MWAIDILDDVFGSLLQHEMEELPGHRSSLIPIQSHSWLGCIVDFIGYGLGQISRQGMHPTLFGQLHPDVNFIEVNPGACVAKPFSHHIEHIRLLSVHSRFVVNCLTRELQHDFSQHQAIGRPDITPSTMRIVFSHQSFAGMAIEDNGHLQLLQTFHVQAHGAGRRAGLGSDHPCRLSLHGNVYKATNSRPSFVCARHPEPSAMSLELKAFDGGGCFAAGTRPAEQPRAETSHGYQASLLRLPVVSACPDSQRDISVLNGMHTSNHRFHKRLFLLPCIEAFLSRQTRGIRRHPPGLYSISRHRVASLLPRAGDSYNGPHRCTSIIRRSESLERAPDA